MLHYVIKVIDNSFAAVVIAVLLLLLAIKIFKQRRQLIINLGLALGIMASLVYAVLKRNTGFAVREFYDLGVILLSLASLLVLWLLIWRTIKLDNKKNIDL